MRWDGLFEDLEAQWADLAWQDTRAEAAELTRGEWAGIGFADRLRGARGDVVRVHLAWGEQRDLRVDAVGEGWLAGTAEAGSLLVPFASIRAVEGSLGAAEGEDPRTARRPGLTAVLRRLARARAGVRIVGTDGRVLVEGTPDRVGSDHVDVARHARDEARRAAEVRGRLTVPFSAIGLLAATDLRW